jgi:23S rRNA (cytidine1920-2'-O)/16S rRNA (cytidine1409-2'-O)-methyltransferase
MMPFSPEGRRRMNTRLDKLLVNLGLFDSRARAQAAIAAGLVTVEGQPARSASQSVAEDAVITATEAHPWVGRGALKLVAALELWPITVEGRVVLDVGASTGGFTEVALSRGAARVYAVDVGREQLHARLATDPRVVDLQGTDARTLEASLIPEAPGLIVTDLSFISLTKALGPALALAAPAADLIALVKPQFEQDSRAAIGKGGLVTDPAARQAALDKVSVWLEGQGWHLHETAESPIVGGDGNREWLLWATCSV